MIQKIISKYSSLIIEISIIYIITIFGENFFKSTMFLIDILLFVIPIILLISNGIYVWKNKKVDYLSIVLQIIALLPILFVHTNSNRYVYMVVLLLFMIIGQIFGYTINYFKRKNYK